MLHSSLILLLPDQGLWLNFSSVIKTKIEVYCPALQILSVMVLADLEEHKSFATRGDKAWTLEGQKDTIIGFLLPWAFHFRQTKSVTQTMLSWDANCAPRAARNYQPLITGMTRCSTFSSLAQRTKRNSPNSGSSCPA